MFFVNLLVFCLITLRLKFLKVNEVEKYWSFFEFFHVQGLVFFCFFSLFCLISLRLKFSKVVEGLL